MLILSIIASLLQLKFTSCRTAVETKWFNCRAEIATESLNWWDTYCYYGSCKYLWSSGQCYKVAFFPCCSGCTNYVVHAEL